MDQIIQIFERVNHLSYLSCRDSNVWFDPIECQGDDQPALVTVHWATVQNGQEGAVLPIQFKIEHRVFSYQATTRYYGHIGYTPEFKLILKNAAELCGADAAALTLGTKGDAHQRLAASRDVDPATKAHYDAGHVSMNPTSFAAKAIISGAPIDVEDFAETDGYRQGDVAMRSLVDDTGMRTSLFVPLLSKVGGIGALILFRKEVRPYTADEIVLVESFATQAVIAIENVRQFRRATHASGTPSGNAARPGSDKWVS